MQLGDRRNKAEAKTAARSASAAVHAIKAPEYLVALFLGDLVVIVGASYLTELSTTWPGYGPFAGRTLEIVLVFTLVLYLGDLYQRAQGLGNRELLARVLTCQATAALVLAAVGFAFPSLRLSRSALVGIFLLTTTGLMGWRAALLGAWSQQQLTVQILVLGTGQTLTGGGTTATPALVTGNVTLNTGATVTPSALGGPDASRASPSTLNVSGNLALNGGSTYVWYVSSVFTFMRELTKSRIACVSGSLKGAGPMYTSLLVSVLDPPWFHIKP